MKSGILLVAMAVTLFACQDDEELKIELPVVTTESVTSITDSTALAGGYVTSDGGSPVIAKGICWSTSPYPTIDSSLSKDGTGVGSFTSKITGLSRNTQYFVRAYATNSEGTSYGNEFMFNTLNLTAPRDTSGQYQSGAWSKKTDMPGELRFYPTHLVIGNKLYAGMGIGTHMDPVKDFWEWDPATDTWTRKADYPGAAAFPVTAFSIGGKGYLLTGDTGLNQFWEFDPATNSWTQKNALPALLPARSSSTGFSIGTKGYIALGTLRDQDTFYSDLWEWDQATDTWTSKADFPGNAGAMVANFVIGKKAYIGTGFGQSGSTAEFWEWNQESGKWTRMPDFPGEPRAAAAAFSVGDLGYIGMGASNGRYFNDFWEWNAVSGQWQKLSNFAGPVRSHAIGFSIGRKGYIGLGEGDYNADPSSQGFRDLWEFNPYYPEPTDVPVGGK